MVAVQHPAESGAVELPAGGVPTGGGKTVVLAHLIAIHQPGRTLVLAHREELM